MDKPLIAAKVPAIINLDAGEHYWCACGKSANQPFCDGSHKGTSITPVPFKMVEKKSVFLCQCKQTTNPPYCDGTHNNL